MANSILLQQRLASFIGVAAFMYLSASPARAFTCEDVRRLTSAQQNYYAKLFHIGAAERHQIWVACYVNYHADRTRVAAR
jgi:hypothetical protein